MLYNFSEEDFLKQQASKLEELETLKEVLDSAHIKGKILMDYQNVTRGLK